MFIRNRWWEGVKCCCCSVAQSCPTLCNPMDCSMPGLPVPHYFLEFAQVRIHCIGDAVQLSHPLMPSSSFRSFIQFMRFSRLVSWGGLPFPPPVDHLLSELSAMTCPSWVALHGMAHSFIEFCKLLCHDKVVIHEEGDNMCTCVILAKQYKAESDSEIYWIFSFIFQIARKKQNMLIEVNKRTDQSYAKLTRNIEGRCSNGNWIPAVLEISIAFSFIFIKSVLNFTKILHLWS